MPSKRKKNKRRMRRVQAQRRALEEHYVSSRKRTPGMCAVSIPVTARVPVPKTSDGPTAVPIKTPAAVIAPNEVPAKVLPAEPMVNIPVTDTGGDKLVEAAEDPTEASAESLVEESAVNVEESTTVPVTEVTASVDNPAPIPAESTEKHVMAEPVETAAGSECENKAITELPDEDSVIVPEEKMSAAEIVIEAKPVNETTATNLEPAAEAALEVSEPAVNIAVGSVVEVEAMTVEAQPLNIHAAAEVMKVSDIMPTEAVVEAAGPTEAVVEAAGPIEAVVEAAGPTEAVVEAAGPTEAVVEAVVEAAGPTEAVVKAAGPIEALVQAVGPAEAVVEAVGPTDALMEAAGPIEAIEKATGPTEAVVEAIGPIEAVVETTGPTEAVVEAAGPIEAIEEATEPTEAIEEATEPTEAIAVATGPTEAVVEAIVESVPEQQAAPLKEPMTFITSTSESVAEGFIVTETALAVEAAIPENQTPVTTAEAPEVLSETLADAIPALEPVLVPKENIHAQSEFMAVETEAKKNLAVDGGLTVDTINGCPVGAEVAIEG